MIAYYFDTSALIKQYVNEAGSDWVRQLFLPEHDHLFITSRLTMPEMYSAIAHHLLIAANLAPLQFLSADERLVQVASVEGLSAITQTSIRTGSSWHRQVLRLSGIVTLRYFAHGTNHRRQPVLQHGVRQNRAGRHVDAVVFDEVADLQKMPKKVITNLKTYCESGSFARGKDSLSEASSILMFGSTNQPVEVMARSSHLFAPMPAVIREDMAFLDRIHYYLSGWEVPILVLRSFSTRRLGDGIGWFPDLHESGIR